jgi:enoyl-CoA hydratase/carnithine racemase
MIYRSILYQIDQAILTLSLHRPERLNAFTPEMANELMHAFARAGEDDDIAAIVVTGTGRAFCAGMDLGGDGNVFGLDESQAPAIDDMHERLSDPAILQGVRDLGGRLTLAMFDCNKPIIAAINGTAIGIGATMTLAMDVRLAAENARIGFVFGKLGIVNEGCSSWFLPRIVGMAQALEWIYSADIIDSSAAQRGGLVKAVYPQGQLLAEAYSLAHKFTDGKSPVATMLMRHMLYRNSAQIHPLEAHRVESLAMFYASIGDGKEGVNAFLEKRSPSFKSKVTQPPPFFPWWQQ